MHKGASILFPDTLTVSFLLLSCIQSSIFVITYLHYDVKSPYIIIIYSPAKNGSHVEKFTIIREDGKEVSYRLTKDKVFRGSYRRSVSLTHTCTFKNFELVSPTSTVHEKINSEMSLSYQLTQETSA